MYIIPNATWPSLRLESRNVYYSKGGRCYRRLSNYKERYRWEHREYGVLSHIVQLERQISMGRRGVWSLVMCVPETPLMPLSRGLIIYQTTGNFSPDNL